MADLLAVLGLCTPCTEADVKSAYRSLALKYHPDKIGPAGTERMKELNVAYEKIMKGQSWRGANVKPHLSSRNATSSNQTWWSRATPDSKRPFNSTTTQPDPFKTNATNPEKKPRASPYEEWMHRYRSDWQGLKDGQGPPPNPGLWEEFIFPTFSTKYRRVWTTCNPWGAFTQHEHLHENLRRIMQTFEVHVLANEPNRVGLVIPNIGSTRVLIYQFHQRILNIEKELYRAWQYGHLWKVLWAKIGALHQMLKQFKIHHAETYDEPLAQSLRAIRFEDMVRTTGVASLLLEEAALYAQQTFADAELFEDVQ